MHFSRRKCSALFVLPRNYGCNRVVRCSFVDCDVIERVYPEIVEARRMGGVDLLYYNNIGGILVLSSFVGLYLVQGT